MDIVFEDNSLQEIYEYGDTKSREYVKYVRDKKFVDKLRRQIDLVRGASSYKELKNISPLHYEDLKHEYAGYTSFRIFNDRVERVICKESDKYLKLTLLKLDDTHYENKK